MKRQLYLFILFLATLALPAACTTDEMLPDDAPTAADGQGQLRIVYRIAGNSVQTKADTEAGDDGLNENTIKRLDLFAVNNAGSHTVHNVTIPTNGEGELTLSDDDTEALRALLTSNTTFYLVANCPDAANIDNITTLRALKTPDNGFDFRAKQETFVMDAVASTGDGDHSKENVTVTLNLRRALSKIRLDFKGATVNEYQFFNHADQSYVLSKSETSNNNPVSMTDYEAITTDAPLKDSKDRYVFYSYANDWFKADLYTQNSSGQYVANNEGMHNGEPIIAKRQTYLMVKATYQNEEYYYRIPVNSRLPQTSDQPTYTKDEVDEIHNLYRLQRNHLYDISVTIDGPGGTVDNPAVPAYTIQITDWEKGNEFTLSPDAFK